MGDALVYEGYDLIGRAWVALAVAMRKRNKRVPSKGFTAISHA